MGKIVVMGGSFNPPTMAHLQLLLTSMDAIGADRGIFVPTPARSLRRKMRKSGFPEEVLSEDVRFRMLSVMSREDMRISVDDVEYRNPKSWYTLETMRYLWEKNPDAELYFLIGGDKVEIFANAHRLPEFARDFHYLVVTRKGEDPESVLRSTPNAAEYLDCFHILPAPSEAEGISSTEVRRRMREGMPVPESLVHPKVMELMNESGIWTASEK